MIIKFVFSLLIGIIMFNGLAGAVEINGFAMKAPVTASNNGKYTCLNKKLVESYWEYPNLEGGFVAWQSAVVPKTSIGQTVTLRFACGLGAHGDSASHQLYLNNKKLLTFNVQYGEFTVKTTNATFRFIPVYLDENEDLFGVAELTVVPALINFGQAQKLKIIGNKNNSKAWFMLSAIAVPTSPQIAKQRKLNSIKRKIAIIKVIKARKVEYEKAHHHTVCHWLHNRQAAVSLNNLNERNNDYEGAKKLIINHPPSADKFEATVDQAIKDKAWLIVEYADKYFTASGVAVIKQHKAYLQKLDCVIWSAPVDKVAEYIRMRQLAKLIVEQKSLAHARVTIHGLPSGFKATLPLTVQVKLPNNAWGIRVISQQHTKIANQLIVTAKTRGVRFDMTPGNGPVDIYYNN